MDWSETEVYTGTTFNRYIIFFYYSVLTLVSNELVPTTQVEVNFSIIILLTGSLATGVLIGEFSSIMNDMGEKAEKANEEFDMIQSIMQSLMLPEEIQMHVIGYYEQVQIQKYVHVE